MLGAHKEIWGNIFKNTAKLETVCLPNMIELCLTKIYLLNGKTGSQIKDFQQMLII